MKDAASAAVYGARAANGVVLVMTKKGAEGKVKVNYDFSFGWQSAWKHRDMLNASQYATLMNEAATYNGTTPKFENPATLGAGTDWQNALFNDGAPVQNHQLSISGASEKINYYFSMGYITRKVLSEVIMIILIMNVYLSAVIPSINFLINLKNVIG